MTGAERNFDGRVQPRIGMMRTKCDAGRGLTLIEMLVVIAIIGILAALLLPALSRAKASAHSASCKNRLQQMGVGLQMYVHENENEYPYWWTSAPDTSLAGAVAPEDTGFWWAKLSPYYPVKWTTATYHCPGYKGAIAGKVDSRVPLGSYAYNGRGVSMPHFGSPYDPNWGLGPPQAEAMSQKVSLTNAQTRELRVKVPSDMLAIGESRFLNAKMNGIPGGQDLLACGVLKSRPGSQRFLFDPARHGANYNLLFCDGHVSAMKPAVLFNPTNTAVMWNSDHQPHPELWVP